MQRARVAGPLYAISAEPCTSTLRAVASVESTRMELSSKIALVGWVNFLIHSLVSSEQSFGLARPRVQAL
jgi:hypothetical protein